MIVALILYLLGASIAWDYYSIQLCEELVVDEETGEEYHPVNGWQLTTTTVLWPLASLIGLGLEAYHRLFRKGVK